eukprot:maker-scaffold_48-snap-gene-1.40-mRNA-1 protein AED:0.00 eAED:0.00 QI:70/1/1/1/1/1/2/599/326
MKQNFIILRILLITIFFYLVLSILEAIYSKPVSYSTNVLKETDVFKDISCSVNKTFIPAGVNLKSIAISSYPGSGNTFSRILLEEVFGIYSGSLYFDNTLSSTFPGEKKSSNVIFVKTHFPCKNCWNKTKNGKKVPISENESGRITKKKYAAVLQLIRNPFRTFLAEFQRKYLKFKFKEDGSHINQVDWNRFDTFRAEFKSEFNSFIKRWSYHTRYYALSEFKVFSIYFEDLIDKQKRQKLIQEVIKFAFNNLPQLTQLISEVETLSCVKERLNSSRLELFHRKKKNFGVSLFSKDMIKSSCNYLKSLGVWNHKHWGECENTNIII